MLTTAGYFFSMNSVFKFLICTVCLQGGKKRSSFYYDLWNIKYLSKFKWDDLTEELGEHFMISVFYWWSLSRLC